MNRTRSARRIGGLTLAGAVALATVAVTSAPASAAALDGQAQGATIFSVTTEGGATGTCSDPSGMDNSQIVPFSSNGVPANINFTSNGVTVDSGEGADTTSLSASVNGTASATEVAGGIKTFDFKSTLAASVTPAQGTGSDCDADASAQFATVGLVTVTSTSIMVLDTKTRGGVFTMTLAKTSGTPLTTVDVDIFNNGKERKVITIPAGQYSMSISTSTGASSPQVAGDPTSSNSVITAHAEFYAPGSALAPRAGSGKKFMKLPDTLNCAGDSVTADFTRKAGKKATAANGLDPKIRNAKFYVNGDKVKTKRKPHKNTNVTLGGLDDTDEVAVRAVLKLWDKSKVEVTRNYLPCS